MARARIATLARVKHVILVIAGVTVLPALIDSARAGVRSTATEFASLTLRDSLLGVEGPEGMFPLQRGCAQCPTARPETRGPKEPPLTNLPRDRTVVFWIS